MIDIEKLLAITIAIFATVIIIIVMLLAGLLLEREKNIMKNYETNCKNECSKFNYVYYKIEDTSTYAHSDYNCWCITKNNSPIDIGSVNK